MKPSPFRFTSNSIPKKHAFTGNAVTRGADDRVVELSCKLAEARAHPLLSLRPERNERYDEFYRSGGNDKLTSLLSNSTNRTKDAIKPQLKGESSQEKKHDETTEHLEAARARAAFLAFHRENSLMNKRQQKKNIGAGS